MIWNILYNKCKSERNLHPLLTEFKVHTVSYRPGLSPWVYGPWAKQVLMGSDQSSRKPGKCWGWPCDELASHAGKPEKISAEWSTWFEYRPKNIWSYLSLHVKVWTSLFSPLLSQLSIELCHIFDGPFDVVCYFSSFQRSL